MTLLVPPAIGDPLPITDPVKLIIPTVQIFGAAGTFGSFANEVSTPSGHSLRTIAINNWGIGAGLCFFYATLMSDGQIALSTLPFTEDEIKPTMDHAEMAIFDPFRRTFYVNVIPTSTGATRAVDPFNNTLGGTDCGAGDLRQVFLNGTEYLVSTQGGYYFHWDISVTGLYPVLAYFSRDTNGNWTYNAARSLTSTQWRNTSGGIYDTVIANGNGPSSGLNGTYWYPRAAGQMAILPVSGRTVVGHYFGLGALTGGAISVSDSAGNMLAAYQIPNITPTSGPALTTAAVRDVEADPSSEKNDERFVIIYDQFPSSQQRCFQEFSYNDSTRTITPMSVPTCPADVVGSGFVAPIFSIFGPDGTLYISGGGAGINSANMSVYLKHPSSGERNTVLNAPVFPGWPSSSWPTPVKPDYSLGFAVQQGLGALAGPMAMDPVTGACLVPAESGRFTGAVPKASGLSGNFLSPSSSGFTPLNMLIPDDQSFGSSLGTWVSFLAQLTRTTSPPVPPPSGTCAAQVNPAFGSELINTGPYPVVPGESYEAWVNVLSGSTSRTAAVQMRFYKADGSTTTTLGNTFTAADSSSAWTLIKASATADSNARYLRLFVQFDSPAETHYVASNSLFSMSAGELGWSGFVTGVSISSAQALTGSFSLQISAPFANETVVALGPLHAVIPYQEYLAKASFLATAGTRTGNILIRWFDVNGNQLGSDAPCTMPTTVTTSAWSEAWCGAMAPPGAVTARILLEPALVNVSEIIYADQVSFQEQPYRSFPYVDFGINTFRSDNPTNNFGHGRPALSGRLLYIPVAQNFGSAESALFNSGGYIPQTKPQYVVCINLVPLLGE